ncbi:MAG: dTDP-4-dehydrorhamnose 3,5-epimerase [Hyphomonadaceae bacterium]
MKFTETPLKGAFVVEHEPRADERGYFARAYCQDELAAVGADYEFVQANMSGNVNAGTLRGLHYQNETAPEAKFFRCIRGAVYDVIVDMRQGSETYLQWFGIELTAENRKALLVPPLFAHSYLSLTDGAEVFYQASHAYAPDAERGVRYDDPSVGIKWPHPITDISEKDLKWPDLTEQGLA